MLRQETDAMCFLAVLKFVSELKEVEEKSGHIQNSLARSVSVVSGAGATLTSLHLLLARKRSCESKIRF